MQIENFLIYFASILEDTDLALIHADTRFRDLSEWDSLTALSLIAMVDEEYQIKLTGEDILSSVTLQDLFDKLKAKS